MKNGAVERTAHMPHTASAPVAHGFLLLPPSTVPGYDGVDRAAPFEPEIVTDEIDQKAIISHVEKSIAVLYPQGWRREAYTLFEQSAIPQTDAITLPLVRSQVAAETIQYLIEPHMGRFDIVECQVWRVTDDLPHAGGTVGPLFGYDVAYLDGDYYSAVKNGLHVNPQPALVRDFGADLTSYGLFAHTGRIAEYIHRFRQYYVAEADATFGVFGLAPVASLASDGIGNETSYVSTKGSR